MLKAIQSLESVSHDKMLIMYKRKQESKRAAAPRAGRGGGKRTPINTQAFVPEFVPPPPSSNVSVKLNLEDVVPPKLYKAKDNSTFKDRISGLVGRLHIRLSQYASKATKKLGKSRLSSSRSDFNKKLSEEKVREG